MFNFLIAKNNKSNFFRKGGVVIISLLLGSLIVHPEPKIENLLKDGGDKSWDGTPYSHYPNGKPKISVLKITIPAGEVLNWHKHPMPIAGYLLSGEITLEKKTGGEKRRVTEGHAVTEVMDIVHRGVVTGNEPAVLLVFVAGTEGLPLTQYE